MQARDGEELILNEGYRLAKCCHPQAGEPIAGYFSYNGEIIVHRQACHNLEKVQGDRIVSLAWKDIIAPREELPGDDFHELTELDFLILRHHQTFGIDYSLKVAAELHQPRQAVFDRHGRLRELDLLERVKPLMVQYRKGQTTNRWIKHRNHTYYQLTKKGELYLRFHEQGGGNT